MPVLYAAETRALACLETVVHLNAGGLPFNRYLVAVTIPDGVWAAAEQANAATSRSGGTEPAGRVSISFGTGWLRSGRSALLVVPSVIIPEESNVRINPQHPDGSAITAAKVRKWLYDPRLEAR